MVVTETCLPIKIYLGHILNLINKKKVKHIFVPSLQSIAPKIYNCSKIRGLPDLVRNVVKKDFNIIEPTLDKSAKKQGLYEFLSEAVAPFGITDLEKIKSASKQGWKVYNNFHMMMRAGMSYKKALSNALQGKILIESQNITKPINVALISHGYNIYDERASMKIFEKLEEIANSFDGVEKTFAIQAGREVRIMVKPDVINDETTVLMARDIVKKIESELEYPGQIKVNVIRETRAVDYAK